MKKEQPIADNKNSEGQRRQVKDTNLLFLLTCQFCHQKGLKQTLAPDIYQCSNCKKYFRF